MNNPDYLNILNDQELKELEEYMLIMHDYQIIKTSIRNTTICACPTPVPNYTPGCESISYTEAKSRAQRLIRLERSQIVDATIFTQVMNESKRLILELKEVDKQLTT